MKALILTEGGHGIGLGHVARCTAVGQALREAGVTVRMIVNCDESIENHLRSAGAEAGDWLANETLRHNALSDCDIAIVDSYLAGENVYLQVSQSVRAAGFFDDYIRITYPPGTVINGAMGAAAAPYPKSDDVTYLLDGEYAALRPEFWDVPQRQQAGELCSIMVTIGATDPGNLTPMLVGLLVENFPSLRKRIVVGAAFDNATDIRARSDDRTELFHGPDAGTMLQLMRDSDLAVSACGQTLCELARAGTATIGIRVADNQKAIAEGWTKCGFLEYAGDCGAADLRDSILAAIAALTPATERDKRSCAGRINADGQGARRIAKHLIDQS